MRRKEGKPGKGKMVEQESQPLDHKPYGLDKANALMRIDELASSHLEATNIMNVYFDTAKITGIGNSNHRAEYKSQLADMGIDSSLADQAFSLLRDSGIKENPKSDLKKNPS